MFRQSQLLRIRLMSGELTTAPTAGHFYWPNICCSSSLRRSGSPCRRWRKTFWTTKWTATTRYIYIFINIIKQLHLSIFLLHCSQVICSQGCNVWSLSLPIAFTAASVPHTTSRRVLAGAHHGDLDGLCGSDGVWKWKDTHQNGPMAIFDSEKNE
jgi:hypothetical protein